MARTGCGFSQPGYDDAALSNASTPESPLPVRRTCAREYFVADGRLAEGELFPGTHLPVLKGIVCPVFPNTPSPRFDGSEAPVSRKALVTVKNGCAWGAHARSHHREAVPNGVRKGSSASLGRAILHHG